MFSVNNSVLVPCEQIFRRLRVCTIDLSAHCMLYILSDCWSSWADGDTIHFIATLTGEKIDYDYYKALLQGRGYHTPHTHLSYWCVDGSAKVLFSFLFSLPNRKRCTLRFRREDCNTFRYNRMTHSRGCSRRHCCISDWYHFDKCGRGVRGDYALSLTSCHSFHGFEIYSAPLVGDIVGDAV